MSLKMNLKKLVSKQLVTRSNSKVNLEDQEQSQNTCYEVIGSVIHLGKSIHVGHYVAYARKDGGWVYCNDSKIAKSLDPKLGKSYIFFLRRKEN